jgi:hypothetical protein
MPTYKELVLAARESGDYTQVNQWLENYRRTPNDNDPLRVSLELNDHAGTIAIMERVYDELVEELKPCFSLAVWGQEPEV